MDCIDHTIIKEMCVDPLGLTVTKASKYLGVNKKAKK
jgi:hypothetical protein